MGVGPVRDPGPGHRAPPPRPHLVGADGRDVAGVHHEEVGVSGAWRSVSSQHGAELVVEEELVGHVGHNDVAPDHVTSEDDEGHYEDEPGGPGIRRGFGEDDGGGVGTEG
eukprot:276781_1